MSTIVQDYLKIDQLIEEISDFNPRMAFELTNDSMRIEELKYEFFAKYGVTYDEFKLNYRGYLK